MTDNFVTFKDMAELVEKFDAKLNAQSVKLMEYIKDSFDTQSKSLKLYMDNTISSHTGIILNERFADKSVEKKVEDLQEKIAKEVIEQAAETAKDKIARAENKAKQDVSIWKIGVIWTIIGVAIGVIIQVIIKIKIPI